MNWRWASFLVLHEISVGSALSLHEVRFVIFVGFDAPEAEAQVEDATAAVDSADDEKKDA